MRFHFISALAGALLLSTQAYGVSLNGCVVYTGNSATGAKGMYTFDTTGPASLQALPGGGDVKAQGGATLAGEEYYAIDAETGVLNVYDPETWKASVSYGGVIPALDMTYDVSDGKIYGIFLDNASYLGVLDTASGKYTALGTLNSTVVVIMSDGKGKLYGIGMEGNLYSISKTDAALTLIGNTGVSLFLTQSATIDPQTGKCYWAAAREDYSTGLYEVNLSDGSAKLLYDFPNNEEITGLYVAPEFPAGTPDRATDLAATFDKGSLSGTLDFNMPVTTVSGDALSGSLNWTVLTDGKQVAEGSAQASAKVSVPLTVTPGRHVFTVATSAGDTRGLRAAIEMWNGNDTPLAPSGVTVRKESATKVALGWAFREGSVHGGYVDASALHARVTRLPDGKGFDVNPGETTFVDEISADKQTAYTYTVCAEANGEQSDGVTSKNVTMGPAGTVPYAPDFGSAEQTSLFMTENNSVSLWLIGNGIVSLTALADESIDGWLVFPGLELNADDNYRLSFETDGTGMDVEVRYGLLPSSADMNEVIMSSKSVTNIEKHEAMFHVEQNGEYYIAIHGSGFTSTNAVVFSKFSVERAGSSNAPAAPAVRIEQHPEGALGADISITVPSNTVNGKPLEGNVTVTILRDGEIIKTFDSAAPGSSLTYSDSAAKHGMNLYEVYAGNDQGDGEHSAVSVFTGNDVPAAPTGIKVVETEEGHITITWDVPVKGANGGYVDPSALTYTVVRNGWKEIARGSETTASDFFEGSEDTQLLAIYDIKAASAEGEGPAATSRALVVGKTYMMPYKESFPGGKASTYTWASLPPSNENMWMPWSDGTGSISSYDGDGGCVATANFMHVREHMELVSPKISVKGAVKPVIEFYLASTPSSDSLVIDILADGTDRHHVSDIALADGIGEWRKVTVPLNEYTDARWIQLSLSVSDLAYEDKVYVDAVSAYDDIDINLAAGALSVPLGMTAGVESAVTAEVRNVGKQDVESYTVALYEGERMVASTTCGAIKVGESAKVELRFAPLAASAPEALIHAVVECDGDLNTYDNVSEEVAVPVEILSLPRVGTIDAYYDGSVRLGWQIPDLSTGTYEPFTESFEDMKAFTTTDFGEWTAVEGDPDHQYNMEFQDANGNFIVFPGDYAWQNYAFTVVDLLKIPTATPEIGWSAVSGNRFLMTAYSSPSGSDTYVGDYIISPRLKGCAQDITVHAKSLNYYEDGLESMWIMYSKSGTDFEDFDILTEIPEVPDKWTRYTFSLPEGTQYFAIFSYQTKTALFLDDITYIPADAKEAEYDLKGFNVYRDGTLLNDEPVAAPAYTDATAPEGSSFSYSVSAVYANGESALSEPVSLTTAVDGISAGNFRVTTAPGMIVVEDSLMRSVEVYTTDGRLAASSEGAEISRFRLSAGLYIVRAGDTAVKAVVR